MNFSGLDGRHAEGECYSHCSAAIHYVLSVDRQDRICLQPCFFDLSTSLRVLQQGEAYVYGEGMSRDFNHRIDEDCVMFWIENINIFELKKIYEEVRYRMLLTLDHLDVQAMWAYKSYCFSGTSSTKEDISCYELRQEEICEYTKRLRKEIKVIFNE